MVHDESPSDHAPFLTPHGEAAYKRLSAQVDERPSAREDIALILDELDATRALVAQSDADLEAADRDQADLKRRIDEHIETHICEFNGPAAYEGLG